MRCLKKLTQKSPHFVSFRAWFRRASRCTLRGNRELRIGVESFVHRDARYEGIVNHASGLNHSCYEGIANHVSEFIIRATSCTLQGNRGLRIGVESFVQQVARYGGIVNYVSRLNHSCNKLHATRESWITYRDWFIRTTEYKKLIWYNGAENVNNCTRNPYGNLSTRPHWGWYLFFHACASRSFKRLANSLY